MKTRTLGRNGFRISEVGLGCWQFGGDFGAMEAATALAIMQESVAKGVTFFDTADVYGGGLSESLIGSFLKECKTLITVATKFGRGDGTYPDQYSEAALRTSIGNSAARLGVGQLDLLQLHCVPTEVLTQGDIFDWLRSAQADGLIKQFGASIETVEQGMICLQQEGLSSLQVILNIFRQKPLETLLPKAQAMGAGIIVRLPLASGLLAGKYTTDTRFEAGDHRDFNRDGQCFNVGETFAGLTFGKGLELAEEIKPLTPEGYSMAEMSLRWILDHEAVSVIIPGASSAKQAQSNAAISALAPLPETLHQALSAFYSNAVKQHIRGSY